MNYIDMKQYKILHVRKRVICQKWVLERINALCINNNYIYVCYNDNNINHTEQNNEMIQNMNRSMTKLTKWHVRPAKTQISLGIRQVWSESSLSAWRKLGSLATHWEQREDWSDWADAQAVRPVWSEPLLGAQVFLLVLSCGGSYIEPQLPKKHPPHLPNNRCNNNSYNKS